MKNGNRRRICMHQIFMMQHVQPVLFMYESSNLSLVFKWDLEANMVFCHLSWDMCDIMSQTHNHMMHSIGAHFFITNKLQMWVPQPNFLLLFYKYFCYLSTKINLC